MDNSGFASETGGVDKGVVDKVTREIVLKTVHSYDIAIDKLTIPLVNSLTRQLVNLLTCQLVNSHAKISLRCM